MTKIKLLFIFILIVGLGWLGYSRIQKKSDTPKSPANQVATFNKQLYSIDEDTSFWRIVNKKRPLPAEYVPANLAAPNVALRLPATNPEMHVRGDIAPDIQKLVNGAAQAGHTLMLVSAYRSYDAQKAVYNSFVSQDGQAKADTYSARPGHSEHQTGLAIDLGLKNRSCELEACFGETEAGKWLAAHAHEYGFVLRYPKGQESIVGYEYEPWHFRFVGPELAAEIHKTAQVLETFFDLPNASSY